MGGGQHHQASARLAHEAFRAAADPARFPEQIKEGLRPWQARKVYQAGGGSWRRRRRGASRLATRQTPSPRRCASRRATSIRCSACRGRSSDRWRARITSARARVSSRRFPARQAAASAIYDSEPRDRGRRDRHPRRRRHVDPAAGAVRGRRGDRKVPSLAAGSRRPSKPRRATRSTASTRARRTRRCPRSRAGLTRVRQLRDGRRGQHAVGRPEGRARLAARSQGRRTS